MVKISKPHEFHREFKEKMNFFKIMYAFCNWDLIILFCERFELEN